jgi:hypothetical protein
MSKTRALAGVVTVEAPSSFIPVIFNKAIAYSVIFHYNRGGKIQVEHSGASGKSLFFNVVFVSGNC